MTEALTVVQSQLSMVAALEAVQRAAFPTLAAAERITAAHYAEHIRRFPEGQLAVVNAAGEVVACSTDFRTSAINVAHCEHRYMDAVADNWLHHHDPQGEWLYGADIGVLPAYRRRGIARRLYAARRAVIRRLNLRGHMAGGLLTGFGAYKTAMSVEAYVAHVMAGEIFDPTVSVQLRCGFTVHGVIQQYVHDPGCDGKAAFLLWHNPDYVPARHQDVS
ncbi:MAG: nitrilase [Candidatus Tectomicrobia bacterium]|uniref:Nitrilase n=1 Tax=Tectimicrobiota bacterium TaxID=2528274 RepID=A0A937VWI7_UNCTE|nr:nitrilase [Candidatus Tectomicrobia bacterium]